MVSFKSKKVLIVDDEKDILDSLSEFLKRSGYEVLVADNGTEGFSLIKKELPHLVILDLMLPDMDGSDIAASMLLDPLLRDIPVIFLTAVLTKTEQEKSGTSIANRCIVAKPCRSEEILAHVKNRIGPAV